MQDISTRRSKSRLLFFCPSSSFSTQDNGFLEISLSRPSVFDNATPPASSCFVNAHRAVFSSGQFNYTGLRLPVPSRLNIPVWRALLEDYEDRVICDFLEFGRPLGYNNQTLPLFDLRTHGGALTFPFAFQEYIGSEISLGRAAGPFAAPPFHDGFVVSPLNTVAKRNSNFSQSFTARILRLLRKVIFNHHHINLNSEFRKDIQWSCKFLRAYNGVSMITSNKGLFTWRWGAQVGEVTRLDGVTRLSI